MGFSGECVQLKTEEPLKNNVSLKIRTGLKIANFLITILQIITAILWFNLYKSLDFDKKQFADFFWTIWGPKEIKNFQKILKKTLNRVAQKRYFFTRAAYHTIYWITLHVLIHSIYIFCVFAGCSFKIKWIESLQQIPIF